MMMRLIVISFLLLSLVGCKSESEKALNASTETPVKKEDVLATVNGKVISNDQFKNFLEFKRIPLQDEPRKARMLDQYLEREALAAVIEEKDFLDNGLIEAELNEFKKEMLISRYFEKYLNEQVTDEAVQNYYNTKASEYEQRKARVAHILIRLNQKMSEQERKVKLTIAQEAYSKIRAGEDFGEIAANYSEDKISAKKKGELGWIKEGSIDRRFSKTAFSLEEGDFSEPIETPFGFHIVKLLDAPQVIKQPFKAVSGNIRYQLRNEAKRTEMERLLKEVKIENNRK